MRPLLYLEIRTFINSLKNTLRSPKRLIPALIMGAMFFSWVINAFVLAIQGSHGDFGKIPPAFMIPDEVIKLISAGAFLFLAFGSLAVMYQACSAGSLVFSIAHIDFLFPTPISRRSVLLVKLAKDYLKYFFWVIFFVTFLGAPVCTAAKVGLFPSGIVSILALTGYLLFVVNVAHTLNIVLTFGFERFKQAAAVIKVVVVLVFASAMVFGVYLYSGTSNASLSFLWAVDSPVIRTIFAPAYWCASLALAPVLPVGGEEMAKLGLIWVLAGATFAVLMSRRENIYEPSLGISVKMSKMRLAMRSGDNTAYRMEVMKDKGKTAAGLLLIPAFGRGATALLWKNLLTRYRMSWSQAILVLIMPALVLYMVQRTLQIQDILENLPYILVYISYILSITVQPQVRTELKHANILKSMPIAGWKVVLVQALSGAIYLSLGIGVFAASMWLLIPASRTHLLTVCALASPALGFACISATIIPALMYPDSKDSAQNFFCNFVGFALTSVAVLPTIAIGIVMLGLLDAPWYLTLAPIWVVNVIIGSAGIAVAGCIFRRFDPTGE